MKLNEYLEWKGIGLAGFAALVGVNPVTVGRWIAGHRFPRTPMLAKIDRVTEGNVRGEDFYPEKRRV
jgi:DNA-binding transcriptional regulator YdaS (Cro superfamily)